LNFSKQEKNMSTIKVERRPSRERLKELGVAGWPIWTKEASEFPWTYDTPETCYFLAGEVTVTGSDGETASMVQGDLVTFPAGMSCTWKISKDVKKHYRFG
jgi:uncharacterized protein